MKKSNIITIVLTSLFVLFFTGWNFFGKTPEYSDSERRVLAKFPEVTMERVLSGAFSKEFEEYTVDRFPMRDLWRTIKAYVRTGVFAQKDNHKIYVADGHISKLEYPMNSEMVDHAANVFEKVKKRYLEDNDIYLAVIPDKNRYLAEKNGYLSIDYDAFSKYIKEKVHFAKYIEIADLLEAEDYYQTDTHWRQEKIQDVADRLASAMGVKLDANYESKQLDVPFYGVYAGQSALFHKPDQITYLVDERFEEIQVEGASAIYDFQKAEGKDSYEMFLSGNQPIVTMKNPQAQNGKRLIIFRDSFASSLAPLMISGYEEIVLVDLRYISSDMLGEYVEFENADVLFLYSTMLLNSSLSMK